jgi:hypothetical protein
MPSNVGRQLSVKTGKMATELTRSKRSAINAGSLALKRSIETRLPQSRRLRGVGKRGARVGVRYDIRDAGQRATSVVRATGPLHLLERDTKPHVIEPKSKGRAANRRQRAGAVRLVDGSFRRRVPHPGTTGQKPFAKGITDGKPKALRAMRNSTVDAVKRGIRR